MSSLFHPALDQDYSSAFVGTWAGTATSVVPNQAPQTLQATQRIDRSRVNGLSLAEMCPGVAGNASLNSSTSFSMEPITCAPISESCGPVTIRYDSGTGTLVLDTLTFKLTGSASGCGQALSFTVTFTGTRAGNSFDGGVPDGGSPDGGAPDAGPPDGGAPDAGPLDAGPIWPPPPLWAAPPGATPASGTYVYLDSDPGDYIGAGTRVTYTPLDAVIRVSTSTSRVSFDIQQGDGFGNGDFQGPSTISQLERGYYPNLTRYPFHDPAFGGLDWFGNGRGCNTLTGWFVVDNVAWSGTALAAIDLRFEQHCEGASPALHGQVHWTSN